MSEAATAVALLFDDAELGGHLRDALRERGARIVHEGPLASVNRQVLQSAGAEVVVINLDDDVVDDLDGFYDIIDGDHPRVVFNDAQASRRLDGWDRARWARHLAAKVMAQGDLDPPRPADAPAYQPPVAELPVHVEPVAEPVASDMPVLPDMTMPEVDSEPEIVEAPAFQADAATPVEASHDAGETRLAFTPAEEFSSEPLENSETLAAELEALLAAGESEPVDDEFGSGLNYQAGEGLELHDGDFGVDVAHHEVHNDMHDDDFVISLDDAPLHEFGNEELSFEPIEEAAVPQPETPAPAARPAFQLDHLSLAPLDDSFAPPSTQKAEPKRDFGASSSWSLVDEEAASAAPMDKPSPAEFGIEKVDASEYLAPEGGENEHGLEAGLSLELVSIEEAIKPQQHEGFEVVLDELSSAVGKIVLLGGAADSTASVCRFLRALPRDLRCAVIHTQHHSVETSHELAEQLQDHARLSVKMAGGDRRIATGELLFVPAGQQVRVLRDGQVESQDVDGYASQQPSIDSSFTTAANVFGRDAIAIIFAGNATDAVAGAQAIHDRGGQVWVESSDDDRYSNMVSAVEAERVVGYSGTPEELAEHLIAHLA